MASKWKAVGGLVIEFVVPVQVDLEEAHKADLVEQALSWGAVGEPRFGLVVDAKQVKSGILVRVRLDDEGEGAQVVNELNRLMGLRLVVGGRESLGYAAKALVQKKLPNLNVKPGEPIPAFWDED